MTRRALLMMATDSPTPTRDEVVNGMREIRAMVERQREDDRLWQTSVPPPAPRPWDHVMFEPGEFEGFHPLHDETLPTMRELWFHLQQELMRLHRAIEEQSSFLDGGAVVSTREWFVLGSWGGKERGMIPRDVVEAMGIDCSAEDRGGTTFFSKEQAEALHGHPDWQPFA